MTTEQKLKELESWADDLRHGRKPVVEVFKHPEMVADEVKRVVAAAFNISIDELESKKRPDRIAWPRQIAMAMTRRISNCSKCEVGRIFGKDHKTVTHAEQTVSERASISESTKQRIEFIEQKLREIFEINK